MAPDEVRLSVGEYAGKLANAMAEGLVQGRTQERREIARWIRENVPDRGADLIAAMIEDGSYLSAKVSP